MLRMLVVVISTPSDSRTDNPHSPDRAQRIKPSGLLGIAPRNLDPTRHKDASYPRHARAADSDDVNPAEPLQCVVHPRALRAAAISMTVLANCSSASRTPYVAAAAAIASSRGRSCSSGTTMLTIAEASK